MFEDICFTLRLSDGTFRTTFKNRFEDIDAAALRWSERFFVSESPLRVQDRGVSSGLTTFEWAEKLYARFPEAVVEASDVLIYLYELSFDDGRKFVVEPDGTPLQYVKPPFAVSLAHREPLRYPVNLLVAALAKRQFRRLRLPAGWQESTSGAGFKVRKLSCIHPWARALAETNPRFSFRLRSVFDSTPGACHILRTMNVLNPGYFSESKLLEAATAAHASVLPGGIWIHGRTREHDFSNHATFFQRCEHGWEPIERIGEGSEIEGLVLGRLTGDSSE